VVSIPDLFSVATAYIPSCYVQAIENWTSGRGNLRLQIAFGRELF
jgi:hypothetical protein